MKKIRLDLDSLDVVTFATDGGPDAPRGTIHGNQNTYFTIGQDSCYGGCMTHEYHTCMEAGPSVGPSCDYICTAQTVGCTTSE
jgi:hypothetical protein